MAESSDPQRLSSTRTPPRGELPMLMSVLAMGVMQSLVRYLGPSVSSWTKTFYRSLFTAVAVAVWMLIRRERIRFNNWPLLLTRGLVGAISITLFFWSIDLIGLLTATLYLYTYPVFAIPFAVVLFKERFSLWLLAPLVAALTGLYLIVNPTFQGFTFGHGIGLATALLGGIARAALRQLRKTDTPSNIVILFMGIAVVLSGTGVVLIPDQGWRFFPTASLTTTWIWILLSAIGVLSAFAHITVTVAYRRLPTAAASIMTMLNLPINAAIAVLYFREPLTIQKSIGGLLITGAGIAVAVLPSLK